MLARRAAAALVLLAGCTDIDTAATTSPTAHESPALDAPVALGPLERIDSGRYLGGSGLDLADDVAVGADGTFYVVGGTASLDFPVTVGDALDTSTPAGCTTCPFDGFVAAIAPTGAALWVRLIQSPGYDRMSSVVVHGDRVWVGGASDGGGIICQLDRATGQDLLCHDVGGERGVSDLAMPPDGSELVAAMIVVAGDDLHLDPAYVDAFAGAHRSTSGSNDGLLVGLSPDFSETNPRRWATYVGGSGVEGGTPSVVRDDLWTIYLGETSSNDAPTPDGFDPTRNISLDGYLAAFSDGGEVLQHGTYVGGSGDELISPNSLFGDRFELYLGLTTTSDDMPFGASVGQPYTGGGGPGCGDGDVWLARLQLGNLVGSATLRATSYFGGAHGERFGGFTRAITASAQARVVMAMQTHSLIGTLRGAQPGLSGSHCTTAPGNADAYVATLSAILTVVDATYIGGAAGDSGLAVAQHIGGPILTIGNTESPDLAVEGPFDPSYGGAGDGFLMAHLGGPFVPPDTDGGCGFCPDGGFFEDAGFPGNGDAGIPPGYDESAGCCGASTPAGGSIALALATLALLTMRARRRRRRAVLLLIAAALPGCADIDTEVTTSPTAHESAPSPPPPLERIDSGRFLGGGGLDVVDDMAMGDQQLMFVVGGTASLDFPVTAGPALDGSTPADCPACPFDGFVAALDRNGAPQWIRLIQSPGYDRLTAVAAVGDSVWVAGSTGDRGDGPGFHGGVDPERGAQDGILCELAALDGSVRGCRYVGGTGASGVADLATSVSGAEVVVAMTVTAAEALHLDPAYSAAFAGAHRATSDSDDGLVLGFGPDLTQPDALRWATYVGGSGAEGGTPTVMRDDTFIYYLGETASDDAPTAGGAQLTRGGGTDAYFAVIDGSNQSLRYATYLGGSGDERVGSNALFGSPVELYLGLTTTSNDMPVGDTTAAPFAGNGGPGCGDGDIWLARIQLGGLTDADTLRSTRYLGGAQGERFGGISEASTFFGAGRILITGQTYSSDFPTMLGAQSGLAGTSCTTAPGNSDGFVAILSPDFFISDASYLGATAADRGVAAVMGFDFPVMVAGATESAGFPAPGPFDTTYGGAGDGFLTAFHRFTSPPFPGDGGPPLDEDGGGIPPDYDESAGCCGASAPSTGSLGLGFATLLMVLFRRRRSR